MATPVSTTAEVDGRETRRRFGDPLLESLLQEMDAAPEEAPPVKKWSSEELLASCQALLEEARGGADTVPEEPSPADDQCLPKCPLPSSQAQQYLHQRHLAPIDLLPPPVSSDPPLSPDTQLTSSERLSSALPAVGHTETSPVTSDLPSGLSPAVGAAGLAPTSGAVAKSPQVSWASRSSSCRDTITPVECCSRSEHSQHLATLATQPNPTKHLPSSGITRSISASSSALPSSSLEVPSLERLQLLQETPAHQQTCHQEMFSHRHSPSLVQSPAQQVAVVEKTAQEPPVPYARSLVEQSLSTPGQAPVEKVSLGRLVLYHLASPLRLQLEQISSLEPLPSLEKSPSVASSPEQISLSVHSSSSELLSSPLRSPEHSSPPVKSPLGQLSPLVHFPPEQLSSPINSPPEQLSPVKSSPEQLSPLKSPPEQLSSPVKSPPEQLSYPVKSPPEQLSSPVKSPPEQLSPLKSPPEQLSSPVKSPRKQLSPSVKSLGLSSTLELPLEEETPLDRSPSVLALSTAMGQHQEQSSSATQPQHQLTGGCHSHARRQLCHLQQKGNCGVSVRDDSVLSVDRPYRVLNTIASSPPHTTTTTNNNNITSPALTTTTPTSSTHTTRSCQSSCHVHHQCQTASCFLPHRTCYSVIIPDTCETRPSSRPCSHSCPGFVPTSLSAVADSLLPSAGCTCSHPCTTVTADVTSEDNVLTHICLNSVSHISFPAALDSETPLPAPDSYKVAPGHLQEEGTSLNHGSDGVCVGSSGSLGGVQLVSHAWPLDGSSSSVSSSCPSLDNPLVGEALVSDTEDDESLFSFKTCSSSDNDESGSVCGGGTWCSCGEVFSTDGEAATDTDSEYSMGRFAPSSEDLWQWNPSYEDDDLGASPVSPTGDSASDARAMASQVLLGQDAAHCQALLPRSVSGHSVDLEAQKQVVCTLSGGDRLTDGQPDNLPRVETKCDTTEGFPGCHTVYPPHTVSCETAGGAGGGGAQCLSLASLGASGILPPALAGDCVDRVSRDDAGSPEHSPSLPRSPTYRQELVDVVRPRATCAVVREGNTEAAGVSEDGSASPHTVPPVPHELCRHHQAPRRPLEPHPTELHHHATPCASTNCLIPYHHHTEVQNMMTNVFSDSNCTLRNSDQKQSSLTSVDHPDPGGDGSNSGGRRPPPAVPEAPGPEPTPQDHTVHRINSATVHDQKSPVRDIGASVVEGEASSGTVNCDPDDIMEVCGGYHVVCSESDVKCAVRGKAWPLLGQAPVMDTSAVGADHTSPGATLPLAPWCRSCEVSGLPPSAGDSHIGAPSAGVPPADAPAAGGAHTAAGPSVNATPQVLSASLPLPSRPPQQLPQLSSPPQTTRADPTCIVLARSGSVACQPSLDSSVAPPEDPYSLSSSQDCPRTSTVIFPEVNSHCPLLAGTRTGEVEMIMKINLGKEEVSEAGGGGDGGGCVVVGLEEGSMVPASTLPGIDYCGATLPSAAPCPPDSPNGLPWSAARGSCPDDCTDRICVRGQHRGEAGMNSDQDKRDSWQQGGDGGQEQRDRRLRGVRREWRLMRPNPAALPQGNHHLVPTRLACPPLPYIDGSLSSRQSASQGEDHERSGGAAVTLDWCDLACWLQGSECQAPHQAGTGGPGWTGSCGHGTVGEAHVARCPGEVIGSLQVLVGDVLWHYPLYGTVQQCRHDADDVWELVEAGQGWHTAINSGGELVTMSSDNSSMAGTASSSTALQTQPSTVANIHGYKVVNKDQAKGKSLLPVFVDGKSSSARDISNSVTFRVKGDSTWQTQRPNRNSDLCDVHMYRGPDSRGGTPSLPEDGDGGAFIKLCGVSLGSRPASPDPYPIFRCHTLPRKAPHLRLSSLPPWTQPPIESPITSPESEVSMSAPPSPRLSQAPYTALQGDHDVPPGTSVASGTPVDTTSRDSIVVSAGDGCLGGSVGGAGDGGDNLPEPPALGTAPPRPPAPSFYQWCHTFARSREAHKDDANHSSEQTATAQPWSIPGPPLRTTSRCGRGTVTPRPYTGGRSNQLLHQALPNAREEVGVSGVSAGSDAMASSSPCGSGRSPPSLLAGTEPPLAGASRAETCKANFQPPLLGSGRQNHLSDSFLEVPRNCCESTGETISAGEDGRSAAVDLTTRRSRPTTSQMTSADTSLAVSHPLPPDDSRCAAPILPPDVSLMGPTDIPDLRRQPVERVPCEGAPPATLEDRRVTTTEAGPHAGLPVWLRIMKSSAAQCSVPAQAPVPQPPIRSSSKLEPITLGIRESGPAHNGTDMPETLPKKYSLPAGLAQAGNTQLYPTPKWLVTDKTELSHNKLGTSQEVPAVAEPSHSQKVASQPVTATAELCRSKTDASQEVAAVKEPYHKQKGFPKTVSATDNPCQRDSSQTVIATAGSSHSQKEESLQMATTSAEPCRCQRGPSQTATLTPRLCQSHKETSQTVTATADPCPSQARTATAELPYSQREPTLNVTAKPFRKKRVPLQTMPAIPDPVPDRKDPCLLVGAKTTPLQKENSQVLLLGSAGSFQSQKVLPQAVSATTEPYSQRGLSQAVTASAEPCSQREPSQAVIVSAEPFNQRGPLQEVVTSAEPCIQRGLSQALTTTAEPCIRRDPSQAQTATVGPCSQKLPLQVATTSAEPYHSQKGPPQAVTALAEPCSSQGVPSQALTTSLGFSQNQEGSSQVETARLEPFCGQIEPSQAGNATSEPYHRQMEPLQSVTVINKDYHSHTGPPQVVSATNKEYLRQREPLQAGNTTNEDFQRGPSQTLATTDGDLLKQIQTKAKTATNDICLGLAGPSEAINATNEVCLNQRESAQAADVTTAATEQRPPKSSTSDTQSSSASTTTSEVPPARDLDLTHPQTAPLPSVPSHHQRDTADDSVPASHTFQSASGSPTPGSDRKKEVLCKREKDVYICDEEPRKSRDVGRCGDGNNEEDFDSICENRERVEEPHVVRNSSSCLSGGIMEEQTGSLSGGDTLRDTAVGGVVTDSEPEEMPSGGRPAVGNTVSMEEGEGMGQGSCGVERGTGTDERTALITPHSGGQTRPRSTRFPLDIICGTRLYQHKDDEHSPSRCPRQRLSSVDHVQLLIPDPAHGNSSARSKSASRIGSRTTDAAVGAVLHTLEFDAFGRGTGEASDTRTPENNTTSPLLVFPAPILPLDTVLENKIKLTIDSCTGNRRNSTSPPTVATDLLPELGTPGSPEDSEAPQNDDVTSRVGVVGGPTSDVPTYGVSVSETSPEHLEDVSKTGDTIITKNTVVTRDALDNVVIIGNDKFKEVEEIHLKGDTAVNDVCSGGVQDVGEEAISEKSKINSSHTPQPHSSVRRLGTKLLPATVNDSVAREVADLTYSTSQPDGGGADVKELLTSVIQGEEPAACKGGFTVQARQDSQQHQYSQGIPICVQQQQQEKVSKKEGEDGAAVPDPTTSLRLETPPHQLDRPTVGEEPSYDTESSRGTTLLPNHKPGLLYTDKCESGPNLGEKVPGEVMENTTVDDQQEFDGLEESSRGHIEVEGHLRGQYVEDAPHPSLQSFGFPQWIQTLNEKLTDDTVESELEGTIAVRKGSHDEQRVDFSGSGVVRKPVCVVVEDTVESQSGECGEHDTDIMREESVEEYEQALEAVTPEPSHGFSQSSASVATVVRVDTPCDTHIHLPPEDEEAEDEFVDASDNMELDKSDAKLVEEVCRGEHHLDTQRSSPTLAQPVAMVGVTSQEDAMSRTLSVATSDTQSSGTSHTSSVDMCGTQSAGIINNPAVSTSGSVSVPLCQDQQPVTTGRRGSDMPEDGSTSSGGHITDPDMLASASASSTGSETWWTSGGGPAGQRDLLPLDKDEEEMQWRALLAVNLPDEEEEEPTGYESDEDFDTVDADMRRLEEKLRKFERELGENSEEDSVPKNRKETSQSLQISSLPQVFPTVSSAKTKHLSLMSRLEVQEYGDSTSESDTESEAASSSDSADFLFVKTKIKLKPGDRKCRSLDEKRSKNYNILNKSREERRRSSRVKENSCVCEEQLDLSNLNLQLGTVVEEVGSDGREETRLPSAAAEEAVSSTMPTDPDQPEDQCPAPARPVDPADEGQPVTGGEDASGSMLCGGEDHLLLGYIWHEEDGMAAVDFEGLEDFRNFEGQGALMIMYEDDHDDKLNDEDVMFEPQVAAPEYLVEESECESSWSRGSSCGASVSSPHQSRTFLSAFKSSLRKASKYLGPKGEARSKKTDQSPDQPSARSQEDNELVGSSQLPPDLPYQGRRCSMGVDDDSSAGVYNVQSGRVAPVSAIPTSDSEGPDAFSCSSGEYYAAPALCVNTSDEDPAAVPAIARGHRPQQPQDPTSDAHRPVHNRGYDTPGPPPIPPPRWVQRRSYVPQNLDAGLLNQRLSSSSEGHDRSAAATVSQPHPTPQPSLRTTSQKVTHPPPTSATHVHSPVECFINGKETQFYLLGVPSVAPGEGETCQPVMAPGPSGRLVEDWEPDEPGVLPPPHPYTDDAPPGGGWLPHGYPHFTVPNHGNYSCVVPSHRHLRGDGDLPVGPPLHIGEASPSIPSHKPVSVKQLKRKQQEKVLRQEAEEGLEALGCTYCMGVPQMRGRPPEDASHWRQPSPHPRAISDRRSWPPRVSCLVPLTRWSLPALTCSHLPPQPHTPAGQPCLYFSRAVIAAAGAACCSSNSHDPPHRVHPPRVCRTSARSTPGSADSQISLGEEPPTDTSSHRSPGPTSSPESDSDPYWTPVVCLGSRSHRPQPPACHAAATVTPSSPSTDPCLSLTNPALTTDIWTPTMDITPYHYLYAQTSELTSEFWVPGVEHSPLNPTERHHPVLTTALWPPVANTSRHEGEDVPVPSDCWPPLVETHSLTHKQEYSHCGDTHHTGGDAPNIPPQVHKPLSASTSAVRWPEAVVPLTLPQASPLPTYSCPLLIFMSVLDLTGEHVTPEHARDPTLGNQGPHPPPYTHSRPPVWAAATNSTSSVEWDPFLKYSASESDVDSG